MASVILRPRTKMKKTAMHFLTLHKEPRDFLLKCP